MKTFLKTTILLLILANLGISCKKESENATNETSLEPTQQITDPANNDTTYDSTATAIETTSDKQGPDYQNGTSKQAETTATSSQSKSGKTKKESGMSAPDGTDAENHDGDMYTKNDNTKMPSGTPIK